MSEAVIVLVIALITLTVVYVQWLDREKEIQLQHLAMAVGSIMETIEEMQKQIDEIGKEKE
jgi:peptidoglycan hydrolase CwlO-like protein